MACVATQGVPDHGSVRRPAAAYWRVLLHARATATAKSSRAATDVSKHSPIPTAGTTSTCAFDAVEEIATVCKQHGVWVHVDAAYGGAYACLPEVWTLGAVLG